MPHFNVLLFKNIKEQVSNYFVLFRRQLLKEIDDINSWMDIKQKNQMYIS